MRPAVPACLALLCCVAAGLGPVPAAARGGAGRTFTLEHAISLRSYSELTWSADGRRLAFVVAEPDTAESATNHEIWLAGPGSAPARRLTRHPKGDVSPTFSPSGDTIAFVSTRGADERPGIWMMDLAGGDPWPFGRYDEAIGEVRWSPDGRWLAYVQTDTLPARVREWRGRKRDAVIEDERLQYPHLWVVEIATGRRRRLVDGERYVWHVRWSPDSRRLACLVSPTGSADDAHRSDIAVVEVTGGAVRTTGLIAAAFSWSPDGRWLAAATSRGRDSLVAKTDVWVAPAAGGEPVNLTAGFDEDGRTPAWSAGSDTLFFHAWRGAGTVVAAVPRAGGPVRIVAGRGGSAGAPVSHTTGRAAWVASSARSPEEVMWADHPALDGMPVTDFHAGIASLELGATSTVRWTSTDGVAVEAVLLRPPGAPPRAALPTLVWLHGAPYGSRADFGFQPVPQFLAAHGYQVFMPNYRASGGYGTAFLLRRRADWGAQDWDDVASGIDSLIARGLADGDRLGLFGGSYGGYLTAWGLTRTTRFDAACVNRGIVDLPALWAQSDVHRYREFEFRGRPWETPGLWRGSSPIEFIDRVRTPTLIIVGENDRRTPVAQMQALYQSLKSLGVPVQMARYPREGHGLREPRHRADELERLRAWFDRWVR
jgi:dipeptidyl aminopeptidase/acylaminoacyl peptidase